MFGVKKRVDGSGLIWTNHYIIDGDLKTLTGTMSKVYFAQFHKIKIILRVLGKIFFDFHFAQFWKIKIIFPVLRNNYFEFNFLKQNIYFQKTFIINRKSMKTPILY